jgi:hypothetical protein
LRWQGNAQAPERFVRELGDLWCVAGSIDAAQKEFRMAENDRDEQVTARISLAIYAAR